LKLFDFYGLAPGDLFDTQDAAAQDALIYFRGLEGVNDWEYAAAIYYLPAICKYSYNEPLTMLMGGTSEVNPNMPGNSTWTGDIHNHPINEVTRRERAGSTVNNNTFSPADIMGNKDSGTTGYLITPSGGLSKYTPSTWRPVR